MKKTLLTLCLGAAIALPVTSHAAIAHTGSMFFDSEPGNWVGAGMTNTWVHGIDGVFYADRNYDGGVTIRVDDGDYWRLEFAPPQYQPATNTVGPNDLEVGYFQNATRFPFNSPTVPGLSVSGDGRGHNTSSGWFQVFEVDYNVAGEVLSFAADFMQYGGEEQSGPGLFGSVRFNSDLALHTSPVPVPAAVWLFGSGLVGLIAVSRRKSSSTI